MYKTYLKNIITDLESIALEERIYLCNSSALFKICLMSISG